MGATVRPATEDIGLGPIAEEILRKRHRATLVVKIKSPLLPDMESEKASQGAISVLVDKWFAENTYHAEEFADLRALVRLKESQGLRISRSEEHTSELQSPKD